jgi:redox-sensitive bicupin YhaK (pirin superfamily)
MPAVTPADPLALPRVARPVDGVPRDAVAVVDAPRFLEGEGFEVRRAFAGIDLRLADPFLLLDHMGAVEYAPGEAKGAPDHPHRGFETVTYMIDGKIKHRDSNGGGGVITDGATQWMTAGAGIVHSEMPTEDLLDGGGLFHGVQLWVNLPKAQKWSPPRYQDIGSQNVALLSSEDGGAVVRVIAGSIDGHDGPGSTRTPITYAHVTLSPGARLRVGIEQDCVRGQHIAPVVNMGAISVAVPLVDNLHLVVVAARLELLDLCIDPGLKICTDFTDRFGHGLAVRFIGKKDTEYGAK